MDPLARQAGSSPPSRKREQRAENHSLSPARLTSTLVAETAKRYEGDAFNV